LLAISTPDVGCGSTPRPTAVTSANLLGLPRTARLSETRGGLFNHARARSTCPLAPPVTTTVAAWTSQALLVAARALSTCDASTPLLPRLEAPSAAGSCLPRSRFHEGYALRPPLIPWLCRQGPSFRHGFARNACALDALARSAIHRCL
jgi:hypothetical protein